MDITTCKDQFLKYLEFEKRYSNNTVLAYSNDLTQFITYLEITYQLNKIGDVDHTVIRSWIVSLMDAEVTARSVNRKITTLKTLYRFLMRQGIVTSSPMNKVLSPKTAKRLPVFVEKEKMQNLLTNIDFGNDFEGRRNKLIIELFYASGIRLSELINIHQSDVDMASSQIKVLGKRNKERIVPFNSTVKSLVNEYYALKPGGEGSEFLFVDAKGKKIYQKLVYRIVNAYLSEVTTLNKKSPHVLRHTFATHMLNNGADLNVVKELLGHANLSATQIYTHNTVEKLKNIHKQAHPRGE